MSEKYADEFEEITSNSSAKIDYNTKTITVPVHERDKIAKKVIYQFNDNKKIINIKEQIMDSSLVYSYNEYIGNKLLQSSNYGQSDLYKYDENGNRIELQVRVNNLKFTPDMTESGIIMKIISIFHKDSIEQITQSYDTDKNSQKRYLDRVHKEIFASSLKNNVKLYDYSKSYKRESELETKNTFDKYNRKVEENQFYNKQHVMRTRYVYDEHGNYLKEFRDFLPDVAVEPAYQRKYEYDKLGNWTKYYFYEGNNLLSITTRDIEYE